MYKIGSTYLQQRFFPSLTLFVKTIPKYFFPPRCLECHTFIDPVLDPDDRAALFFCDTCIQKGYQRLDPPFCERCGKKMNSGIRPSYLCGTCIRSPGKINHVRAAVLYDGIIRIGLHRFKYSGKMRAASFFEPLLFQAFETFFQPDDIDVIIPIPLHISKLKKRGFNQSYVMVKHFKKIYQKKYGKSPDWKMEAFVLNRQRKTESQTGFTPEQRRQNIKNAFAVERPAKIIDKRILLIDDVYTTGATASEAAGTLLEAGAASVDMLVLARA